jgi:hypothetical protein
MNIFTILFIIVLIVLLFVILRYTTTDTSILTTLSSATVQQTVSANKLTHTDEGASSNNFSYSIWFYVNDWNYKYGEPKVVFGRMGGTGGGVGKATQLQCPPPNATNEGDQTTTPAPVTSGTTTSPASVPGSSSTTGSVTSSSSNSVPGTSGSNPCPLVALGDVTNDLNISVSVFPGVDAMTSVSTQTCNVPNVPIQRWVNLLISLYGRTLDVYLDGKLVKTCVLAGIAKVNSDADVYVTPTGGFSGWTSKLQYFNKPTDPQTAWNIYRAGYGAGMFSNVFSSYEIKLSVLDNGQETGSLTI